MSIYLPICLSKRGKKYKNMIRFKESLKRLKIIKHAAQKSNANKKVKSSKSEIKRNPENCTIEKEWMEKGRKEKYRKRK